MKKRVIKLGIANEGEILEFLTYIMRREDEEIRMADSFKAAELLGKHYGMFGGKSESGVGDVIIVDNIEKAEQIKERKNAVQS
ncbi:MAG: hypothetical protein ACLR19_07350 [Clostridia bacterium]